MVRVTIPVQVPVDFTIIKSEPAYGGKTAYKLCHYVFSQSIMTYADCEADGTQKYSSCNYTAIRVHNGYVQFMHTNHGWMIDDEATKKWGELKAEEELLKS